MIKILKDTIFKSKITIVPLQKVPQFYSILAHWAYKKWHINSGVKFKVINLDYKRRSDSSNLPTAWVALSDGYPVGMISLKEKDLLARPDLQPWLSALYVMPEFRKRGVARQLIQTLEENCKKRLFNKIYLFVDNANEEYLVKYYKKCGWKIIDKSPSAGLKIVTIMRKDFN